MPRPNILFIMPDQLRPDFLGCYGADFVNTPAIDALAASGTRWETAISASPICVPARASMLTGQSAQSSGVTHNNCWMRPDRQQMGIRTWPEYLGTAGYRTIAVGKMHFYPWDLTEGFQTRIISEDKRHVQVRDDYHHALRAEGYSKLHARHQPGYAANKGASINELPDHLQPDRWVAHRAADYIRTMEGMTGLGVMVRTRRWKLMRYENGTEALYDLETDPTERTNRISDCPEIRAELDTHLIRSLLNGYRQGHGDKLVAQKWDDDTDNPYYGRNWQRPWPARLPAAGAPNRLL